MRFHLTRCGWRMSSGRERWQKTVPAGHFCVDCLLERVRSFLGNAHTEELGGLRAELTGGDGLP